MDIREHLREHLKEDVTVIGIVFFIMYFVNQAGVSNEKTLYFTDLIFSVEGATVGLFQTFQHPLITKTMIGIYLFLYPVLLLGTYYVLKRENVHIEYAKSYVMAIIISAPIFYFIPVQVSGFYLPGTEPILYSYSPITVDLFTSLGEFYAALPSLHTGLAALAAFHIRRYDKKLGLYAWFCTFLIMISTFYLGIHWMMDAIIGIILAYICYRSILLSYDKRAVNLVKYHQRNTLVKIIPQALLNRLRRLNNE